MLKNAEFGRGRFVTTAPCFTFRRSLDLDRSPDLTGNLLIGTICGLTEKCRCPFRPGTHFCADAVLTPTVQVSREIRAVVAFVLLRVGR